MKQWIVEPGDSAGLPGCTRWTSKRASYLKSCRRFDRARNVSGHWNRKIFLFHDLIFIPILGNNYKHSRKVTVSVQIHGTGAWEKSRCTETFANPWFRNLSNNSTLNFFFRQSALWNKTDESTGVTPKVKRIRDPKRFATQQVVFRRGKEKESYSIFRARWQWDCLSKVVLLWRRVRS